MARDDEEVARMVRPEPGDLVYAPTEHAGICVVEGVTFEGQLIIRWPSGDVMRKIGADKVESWHRADWRRSHETVEGPRLLR